MNNNTSITETMGKRIRLLRSEKHMTREMLAEKIDVSSRFLADVELGKAGVSLHTLTRICKVLSTSSDYLLGISDFTADEMKYYEITSKLRKLDSKYYDNISALIEALTDAIAK